MNVLLVGTANRHKVKEIRTILAGSSGEPGTAGPVRTAFSVVGADLLPPGPEVEETGTSFEENASIKARAYATRALQLPPEKRPRWVIADDSGLCVDALGGIPGINSARYAGPDSDARRNNSKLLSALSGVARGERGAEFVCVIACVEIPQKEGTSPAAGESGEIPVAFFARGRCRGEILLEEVGGGGFGYDPLFFYPPLGKAFAELSPEEKNRVSHRGLALERLREHLREIAGSGLRH